MLAERTKLGRDWGVAGDEGGRDKEVLTSAISYLPLASICLPAYSVVWAQLLLNEVANLFLQVRPLSLCRL